MGCEKDMLFKHPPHQFCEILGQVRSRKAECMKVRLFVIAALFSLSAHAEKNVARVKYKSFKKCVAEAYASSGLNMTRSDAYAFCLKQPIEYESMATCIDEAYSSDGMNLTSVEARKYCAGE
jgi:hypothetical protein